VIAAIANAARTTRHPSSSSIPCDNFRNFPGMIMQTIGLLGGMSWESTLPYYRTINETVRDALGGLHSARIVLNSIDFHDVERLQVAGDWERAGELVADAARSVEAGGADFLVLCTNTMHKVAPAVARAVTIPLLHIADPTAAAIAEAGVSSVGLLGTRFTMEQDFYRDRLAAHGITAIVPDEDERECIHRVIYEELCRGVVREASRARYRSIIERLVARGARGIVLGCTEIALLVGPDDAPVPVFDTALLHARAAALRALRGESRRLARASVGSHRLGSRAA
jgi:amino-acid racemase